MQRGTVKHYNSEKGYGFIAVDNRADDIFFHITTWQLPQPPSVGQQVFFDSEHNSKGELRTRIVTGSDANTSNNSAASHSPVSHSASPVAAKHQTQNNRQARPKNKVMKKSWVSSVISALVILVAVYFGGSEFLPNGGAQQQEAQNTQHTQTAHSIPSNTNSDVAVITGDPQIDNTIALIQQGGPFPYPEKDGTTFGNREGRLPKEPRGYYREYTVPTPGLSHRGPRRIVTGGNPPTYYYLTVDHYDSFTKLEVQ